MNLQDAKQFVAHFVKGDYTPEEYATFLQWLRGATADELNAIADEHESLHESWPLSSAVPSAEWMMELEGKLDRVEERIAPVKRIGSDRFAKRKSWYAAASILVLVAAGGLIYHNRAVTSTNAHNAIGALTNTLSNPRGGEQKELVLADGSKVWLNAASSLKYPSSFTGTERIVQLSGEAFFDVVKNPGKPFRVLIRDAEVDVLGTGFNVMDYANEPVSRTTLVEGAVKIASGSQEEVLKPGEQAEIAYSSAGVLGSIKVNHGVNTDAALGWKSGLLQFENADLYTVMRVIERNYNVDIQYGTNLPDKSITGNFSRKDSLAKILEQLESAFNFHFRTDNGKTVTVSL
jgi:ferric-dicitrate binding protein FerR (iron transport regulator)